MSMEYGYYNSYAEIQPGARTENVSNRPKSSFEVALREYSSYEANQLIATSNAYRSILQESEDRTQTNRNKQIQTQNHAVNMELVLRLSPQNVRYGIELYFENLDRNYMDWDKQMQKQYGKQYSQRDITESDRKLLDFKNATDIDGIRAFNYVNAFTTNLTDKDIEQLQKKLKKQMLKESLKEYFRNVRMKPKRRKNKDGEEEETTEEKLLAFIAGYFDKSFIYNPDNYQNSENEALSEKTSDRTETDEQAAAKTTATEPESEERNKPVDEVTNVTERNSDDSVGKETGIIERSDATTPEELKAA